jgi:hypothetical protein
MDDPTLVEMRTMNPAYAEDDPDEEMPLPRESAAPPAEQAQEYDRQMILAVQFLNDALHGNKVNFGGANSKVVQRLYPFYYSSTYKLVLWATVIVHLLLAYLEPLVHDSGDWAHDDGDTWKLSARQALQVQVVCVAIYMFDLVLSAYLLRGGLGFDRTQSRSKHVTVQAALVLAMVLDVALGCAGVLPRGLSLTQPLRPLLVVLRSRRLRHICLTICRALPSIHEVWAMLLLTLFTTAGVFAVFFDDMDDSATIRSEMLSQFGEPPAGTGGANFTLPASDKSFSSFRNALLTLFVLLSTENFPACIQPLIGKSVAADDGAGGGSALTRAQAAANEPGSMTKAVGMVMVVAFIVIVVWVLYSACLLAVVYESFSFEVERNRRRKVRTARDAMDHAFAQLYVAEHSMSDAAEEEAAALAAEAAEVEAAAAAVAAAAGASIDLQGKRRANRGSLTGARGSLTGERLAKRGSLTEARGSLVGARGSLTGERRGTRWSLTSERRSTRGSQRMSKSDWRRSLMPDVRRLLQSHGATVSAPHCGRLLSEVLRLNPKYRRRFGYDGGLCDENQAWILMATKIAAAEAAGNGDNPALDWLESTLESDLSEAEARGDPFEFERSAVRELLSLEGAEFWYLREVLAEQQLLPALADGFDALPAGSGCVRRWLYTAFVQHSEPALEVVESLWFTYLVYSAILANLALLLVNPPRGDEDALGMSGSDVLLFLFLAELLARMYAHGVAAFWSAPWQKDRETGKWAPQFGPGSGRNWNRFDFWVVAASFTVFIVQQANAQAGSQRSSAGVVLTRVARLMRAQRILRLLGGSRKLETLASAISSCTPLVCIMVALLGCLIYSFGAVGVWAFGSESATTFMKSAMGKAFDIPGVPLSFESFGSASLVLYTVAVGNNWNDLMGATVLSVGHSWPMVYFSVFFVLSNTIALSVLTSMIFESFKVVRAERRERLQKHKDKSMRDLFSKSAKSMWASGWRGCLGRCCGERSSSTRSTSALDDDLLAAGGGMQAPPPRKLSRGGGLLRAAAGAERRGSWIMGEEDAVLADFTELPSVEEGAPSAEHGGAPPRSPAAGGEEGGGAGKRGSLGKRGRSKRIVGRALSAAGSRLWDQTRDRSNHSLGRDMSNRSLGRGSVGGGARSPVLEGGGDERGGTEDDYDSGMGSLLSSSGFGDSGGGRRARLSITQQQVEGSQRRLSRLSMTGGIGFAPLGTGSSSAGQTANKAEGLRLARSALRSLLGHEAPPEFAAPPIAVADRHQTSTTVHNLDAL